MMWLRVTALALLLAVVARAWGQVDPGEARASIDATRQQATIALDAQDAACLSKFAVTDCQSKVGSRRRLMLADLKRQEGALKAAERRQKGLEQLQQSEGRAAENAQREQVGRGHTEHPTEQERQNNLDVKRLSHQDQAKAASNKTKGGGSTSALDAATVEKNRTAYQDKVKELEKRRLERDKRLQDSGKWVPPLPVSP